MIKLFVSDSDCTILTKDEEYKNGFNNENLKALIKKLGKNISLIIATGRNYGYLGHFKNYNVFRENYVRNNGACVYQNHRLIYKKLFTKELTKQLLIDFPSIEDGMIFSDLNGINVFGNNPNLRSLSCRCFNLVQLPMNRMEEFLSNEYWPPRRSSIVRLRARTIRKISQKEY